jgi:hypothetical protein
MTDADGSDWPPIRPLHSERAHFERQEQEKIHVTGFEPKQSDVAGMQAAVAELDHQEIKDEAIRRLRVLGEQVMAERPDEHELIDQIEQGIEEMIKDDWSREPEMPTVMAALMGVRLRRS